MKDVYEILKQGMKIRLVHKATNDFIEQTYNGISVINGNISGIFTKDNGYEKYYSVSTFKIELIEGG